MPAAKTKKTVALFATTALAFSAVGGMHFDKGGVDFVAKAEAKSSNAGGNGNGGGNSGSNGNSGGNSGKSSNAGGNGKSASAILPNFPSRRLVRTLTKRRISTRSSPASTP